MKVNAFEGARRVALAVAVLWVIACLGYALIDEPYAHLRFAIAWPDKPAVRTEKCGDDDAVGSAIRSSAKGHQVWATLCFTAHKGDNGRIGIPFALAGPNEYRVNERYSRDVRDYIEGVEGNFTLSPEDAQVADQLFWDGRIRSWTQTAVAMCAGLVIGWLTVAVIGWVVRGFLGIPRGKDVRPAEQGD